MDRLSFTVPGTPVGKGRPRFTKQGHAYTPAKTRSYEALVAATSSRRRRNFSLATRKAAYARDGGKCCRCGVAITFAESNCDHVLPCALGGGNELANAETLCIPCHREFKTRADVRRIAKAKRQQLFHETGKSHQHRTRPIQSRGFDKTLRRKMNGEVVKI